MQEIIVATAKPAKTPTTDQPIASVYFHNGKTFPRIWLVTFIVHQTYVQLAVFVRDRNVDTAVTSL